MSQGKISPKQQEILEFIKGADPYERVSAVSARYM